MADNAGNIYHAGVFWSTVDFDPGPADHYISSAGNPDIYIQKLDSIGEFIWAKRIGGAGYDGVSSIALDASNNIYIAGAFTGSVDFDPNAGIFNLTSSGSNDIYIVKLDSAGNFIWAKKMGGASSDAPTAIVLDHQHNVYITGSFGGSCDFDPGPANYNLNAAGSGDIFISKLDSNGNFISAKRIGGSGSDAGTGIHTDLSGNIYVTGFFTGTVDFNPNAGVYNLISASALDIFVYKSDSSQNFLWAKSIGGSGTDEGRSVHTDATGNVYVTGFFKQTVDFDPGPGVHNLSTGNNENQIFVLKLTGGNGNFVWAKKIMSTFRSEGGKILIDNTGEINLSGIFIGTLDSDPGPGIYNLSGAAYYSHFISRYDSNFNFLWAVQIGVKGDYYSKGNTIYSCGAFAGTSDLDPGAGIYNLTAQGISDIFVSKFSYCGTNYDVNYSGCDSVIYMGTTYYSNFDTVVQYLDIAGCDSNQNTHIIVYPTQIYLTDTACDSYTYNAQTYTQSGVYIQNSVNGMGCAVTTTLNLIINYSDTTDYWQQTCLPSYTLNGQTYTSSGTYYQLLTDPSGCDSTITLHLTVSSCPPCIPDIIISDSIFCKDITESQTWIITSGTVLVPFGTKAKLDAFPDDYIILNPGFKAEAGSVFVAQAYNGCYAGQPQLPNAKIYTVNAMEGSAEIVLYPNPTTGLIHIQHEEKLSNIMIFDMVGKLVVNQKCNGETETNIDLSRLPNGIYHVKVAGYQSVKVVKN